VAFATAIKLSDEPPTAANLGLAEALIGEKRFGEATEVLQSLPAQVSLTARHHKLWGDVYTAQGLFKEADEAYKAASLAATEDVGINDLLSEDTLLEGQEEESWEERAMTSRQLAEAVIAKRRATLLGQT
jgi:thioredoxin-like negative regulator of GroEL